MDGWSSPYISCAQDIGRPPIRIVGLNGSTTTSLHCRMLRQYFGLYGTFCASSHPDRAEMDKAQRYYTRQNAAQGCHMYAQIEFAFKLHSLSLPVPFRP